MLHQQIKDEIKEALKAREVLRLSVLRGLLAAIINELVAQKRKPDEKLDDNSVLIVIKRAVKQRKESIEQFTKGGRSELAEKEADELAILEIYLPETMGKEEIEKVAKAKQQELGITDKTKMGMLMGAVMKELSGKAEGGDVKEIVESLLG